MYKFVKRGLDIALSAVGLAVCLPFAPIVWVILKLDSPGKMFFTQKRVGRGKKLFNLYKLRTMRSDTPRDVPTHLMTSAASSVTRAGRVLRKTSLDELPQLLNILRGDMSVVGPRPALWNQDDLIAERDKYGANAVRPGLTGLAQVSGRDELPIPVKAKHDGEYVAKLGFSMDLRVFLRTIGNVFKAEGVRH